MGFAAPAARAGAPHRGRAGPRAGAAGAGRALLDEEQAAVAEQTRLVERARLAAQDEAGTAVVGERLLEPACALEDPGALDEEDRELDSVEVWSGELCLAERPRGVPKVGEH